MKKTLTMTSLLLMLLPNSILAWQIMPQFDVDYYIGISSVVVIADVINEHAYYHLDKPTSTSYSTRTEYTLEVIKPLLSTIDLQPQLLINVLTFGADDDKLPEYPKTKPPALKSDQVELISTSFSPLLEVGQQYLLFLQYGKQSWSLEDQLTIVSEFLIEANMADAGGRECVGLQRTIAHKTHDGFHTTVATVSDFLKSIQTSSIEINSLDSDTKVGSYVDNLIANTPPCTTKDQCLCYENND